MAETFNQSDFNVKKPAGEQAQSSRVKESVPTYDRDLKRMAEAAEKISLCDQKRSIFL